MTQILAIAVSLLFFGCGSAPNSQTSASIDPGQVACSTLSQCQAICDYNSNERGNIPPTVGCSAKPFGASCSDLSVNPNDSGTWPARC